MRKIPTLCFSLFLLAGFLGCEPEYAPDVFLQPVSALSPELNESSGLALRGDVLWSLNDSGNDPVLYGLSLSGDLIAAVRVLNAYNIDWESLAQDREYLYIADTGNNFNTRDEFIIYRVPIPKLSQKSTTAELIRFRYADHKPGNAYSHNYDAEALAVRKGELWLFTKNRGDGNTNLYRFPKVPGTYNVERSQTLPVNSLVTAADINAESGELAMLSYEGAGFGSGIRIWWAPTSDTGIDWERTYSISIGPADQWEAVAWVDPEMLLLSHENSRQGFPGLALLRKH